MCERMSGRFKRANELDREPNTTHKTKCNKNTFQHFCMQMRPQQIAKIILHKLHKQPTICHTSDPTLALVERARLFRSFGLMSRV